MYSAIHVQDGRLLFDPDAYLPRHDVLYRSPARKPYDGLALGGGRFGGLLWQTERSLEFSLNHTDAVDFGPDGVFKAWAWESEEENTAPFSLGRLSLCAAAPIFGWPYLTAFEQRLRLAQAAVEGCARTPFSQIKYRAFTPDGRDALVINVEARFEEATPLTLRLEKWATPNFFHHYEQIRRPGVCRG